MSYVQTETATLSYHFSQIYYEIYANPNARALNPSQIASYSRNMYNKYIPNSFSDLQGYVLKGQTIGGVVAIKTMEGSKYLLKNSLYVSIDGTISPIIPSVHIGFQTRNNTVVFEGLPNFKPSDIIQLNSGGTFVLEDDFQFDFVLSLNKTFLKFGL